MNKLIFGFILMVATPGFAAQVGKIVVDTAQIHEYPQEGARVVGTIEKDESVAVSNIPTEGFYKVRLKSGDLGWISGNDVFIKPAGEADDPNAKVEHKPGTEKKVKTKTKEEKADEVSSEAFDGDYSRLILAYGLQYPSYSGLKDNFTTEGLSPGTAFQVEFQFRMSKLMHWAIRMEYQTASQPLTTVATGTTQTIKQTSIPSEMGIVFSPLTTRAWRIGFGAYAGIVVNSSVTVDRTTSSTLPHAVYSSIEPCATGSFQMSYAFAKHVALFGEAAYRYDKTATLPKATTAFPTTPSFAIDYSGPLFRAGLEMRF